MATVRFSKDLQDKIAANAKAKMAPAIAKAMDSKLDNSWGQRIYDTLFFEVKPLIAQLPAEWVKTVQKISIDVVAGRRCEMEFTFTTPQPWPHRFPDTELAKKEYEYRDGITLKDHLVWGEFLAEVVAYRERVSAAEARRNEFVESVCKVVDAYTTLAPALKAWPPLWELIPEDVKDKHREIKVREKTEVILDVDIGKLTAMSTAAKMGI
jgi:hypothetical protein